ncbi:UNVERIFIED_CONTAM: hypothetical protein Sradi_6060800 [Sesamum radiatum]|uniref:Uncharacterized protein n=1 Tax=Sesamum radiatum TaxID=300843 RepID=A0AAW2KHF9_SESRA
MIAVFCMLDPLLFYVFPESVPIPMLCGAEHPLFAGIRGANEPSSAQNLSSSSSSASPIRGARAQARADSKLESSIKRSSLKLEQ